MTTSVTLAMAAAAALIWWGMVVAISFLETPLKFRAPGVTRETGLAIGRAVFPVLNYVEAALASAVVVTTLIALAGARGDTYTLIVALVVVLAALLGQLGLVRPALNRRTDRILAGEAVKASPLHTVYIVLEVVKVVGLGTLAGAALTLLVNS